MSEVIKDFTGDFLHFEDKIKFLAEKIQQFRLPSFIAPGENFLGKYLITNVLPYSKIMSEKLMFGSSVFGDIRRHG